MLLCSFREWFLNLELRRWMDEILHFLGLQKAADSVLGSGSVVHKIWAEATAPANDNFNRIFGCCARRYMRGFIIFLCRDYIEIGRLFLVMLRQAAASASPASRPGDVGSEEPGMGHLHNCTAVTCRLWSHCLSPRIAGYSLLANLIAIRPRHPGYTCNHPEGDRTWVM